MTCAYFISDIHLSEGTGADATVLLRFLNRLQIRAVGAAGDEGGDRPTHLFLVGDIFDLWVGGHDYFVKKFAPIVNAVRALAEAGVEILFFEGNHDFHLRGFWEREVGARVYQDAEYFDLAGRTVRVEHGDLINPDDHGYLFLRWALRTPAMRLLALNLPARFVQQIGERASRASRQYTSTAKELPVDEIRRLIRDHVEESYRERPFDLIVSGHVHVADDVVFPAAGLMVRSVNLGSWFDKRRAFVLSETRAEFIDLA